MPTDLTAKPAKRAPDIRTFEDILADYPVLADENPVDFESFRAALLADLAPRSPYATLMATNLVHLEWERLRLIRWISAILRSKVQERIANDLRQRKVSEPLAKEVAQQLATWTPSGEDATLRALAEKYGIEMDARFALAYFGLHDQLAPLERDLHMTEQRRRRLFADYEKCIARAKPSVEDAVIVAA